MPNLLESLLTELSHKCAAVERVLMERDFLPPLDAYVLRVYRQVETTRREVNLLLGDPALGSPQLLAVQFQGCQRLMRQFLTVEAYSLPVVLRFNGDDEYMTALCRLMMQQSNIVLPPPLVATFSTEYYWLQSQSNLIYTSALECDSLLGLPDLYHEVAHLVIFRYYTEFAAAYLGELHSYVAQEKRRAVMEQRGRGTADYDSLLVQWEAYWLIEFTADMVATFLVGEAYGWQHLRLCSREGEPLYSPSLGEEASHPANEARLRGVVAMLKNTGLSGPAQAIQQSWETYTHSIGDAPASPGEYQSCYPDALIISLAGHVQRTCEEMRLCKATDPPTEVEPTSLDSIHIVTLINEAWSLFLADAATYSPWEKERIASLRTLVIPLI